MTAGSYSGTTLDIGNERRSFGPFLHRAVGLVLLSVVNDVEDTNNVKARGFRVDGRMMRWLTIPLGDLQSINELIIPVQVSCLLQFIG